MSEREESRRGVLARVLRWCALGALALLGGRLAARALSNPQACQRAYRCRGCPLLPDCRLPEARGARR